MKLHAYLRLLAIVTITSTSAIAQVRPALPNKVDELRTIPFPEVTNIDTVVMEYDDGSIRLRVTGDGNVEYNGASGVVVEGKHERRIRPDEVQELLEAFRRADFFSLRDDYSVSATDVGSTTTSIQVGNSRKIITDNGVEVPSVLKDVQAAILKYSHSDQRYLVCSSKHLARPPGGMCFQRFYLAPPSTATPVW